LKGSNPTASSGIPENQQTESVDSQNLNDESAVSQGQENESILLQFDQSLTSEEHDDLEQLNLDVEVLQFSENTAIGNKSIENVSSALIPTKKDDEVLALIGDEV
jgi:translation initiation factor 6 (eIF-6)